VPARPPLRVLVAIGLVAGTTLALQVLLTRLFSAVLFYHFSFLAISLGLLGTGGGALLVSVLSNRFDRRALEAQLARWCAVYAALLVVVPAVLVRIHWGTADRVTFSFSLNLAVASVLTALPFLAAGVVIALAVRGYVASIGRLYAADLAGAGLGALAVVPPMWLVDAPTLVVVLGAIAAGASLLLGLGQPTERRLGAAMLAGTGGLIALAAATSLYHLPPNTTAPEGLEPVADRWTPLSRVVGYPPPGDAPFALVFYDRVYAPVPVHRRGEPLPDWRDLHLGPQSIGYALTGPGRALVIGGGGGRDIENALSSGQRRVDVIELNRAIRDVVDDDLREWSGAPYTLPRVHTVIGDGRSTLAARDTRYDQIHIGFTDTLSANSASAFALTEQNLYTVEAFEQYLDHLTPNGVLNVSRLHHLVGDEALRATVLTLEALRRRGVAEPERNVVVVLGKDIFGERFGTVLARLRPYTAAELARVRALAGERGEGIAFAPGGPYALEWDELARAPSLEDFCSNYRFDVCAPTDDRPFFFNMKRLSDVGNPPPSGYIYAVDPFAVLLVTLGILAVLAAAAFVAPLVLAARGGGRPSATSLAFFAAIGLGFLLLEVALVQRFVLFLGFPTYALSVVLFALLLFTGAGSLLSTRLARPREGVAAVLAIALVLIVAAAFGLAPLLRGLIDLPFGARVAVTVALLAPFGLTLGMAMPVGLRRLADLEPAGVPWAWGINGIASVLASVLAIAAAILWGFELTTLLAAACYAGALAHVLLGRWAERETAAG